MKRRLLRKEEDSDPMSVVSNLFDVAMVFAVALMVALVSRYKGKKVGIAYELDNGEIIYVPEE